MLLKNGKGLEKALEEISKFKKKTACKNENKKYAYYKFQEYYERMVEVLGADGFVCSYKYEDMATLANGQCFVFVSCRIDILDQGARSCHCVNGIASLELEYSEKNERYIGINNIGSNGQLAAFKAACKQLNIFNCLYEEKADSENDSCCERNSGKGSTPVNSGENVRKEFYHRKNLRQEKTGASGKPVYVLPIHEIYGERYEQKERELIFYPNQYSKVDGKVWEEFLEFATSGEEGSFSAICSVVKKNGNYVFKSF